MYIPDRSIVQQARAYDAKLSIRWVDHLHRWGVYRQTAVPSNLYDKDVLVMVVQGPGGCYHPLDQRLLDRLRANDLQMRGRRIMDDLIARQERVEAAKTRAFRNDVDAITKELAPVAARMADEEFGAVNVPRTDLTPPPELDAPRPRRGIRVGRPRGKAVR
jgi:hypothetical protein